MRAKSLMVVGTMSSAGKSLLVTGLCRVYARRGIRVAPFKSQNMSNNAAVCPDGAEIGRAQYTQAIACGLAPTAYMNPILLKPEADSRSQVVVMGKPDITCSAREYYKNKPRYWKNATHALDTLRETHELIIIEGAGSPVEINLMQDDIVNMSIARYAKASVLLSGDIDRGGIFAQLLGTLWLLDESDRELIKGLLVNKFRGDLSLFQNGIDQLESKGGVPVLGVIPYMHHRIPEEDAVAIEAQNFRPSSESQIDLAVVRLPRISNFDDFDLLLSEPGVRLRYIENPGEFGSPDAVIIPGTKSTIHDLAWMKSQGLAKAIIGYAQQGGALVGICGGYQMLGTLISDPEQTESSDKTVISGLGLLPINTVFSKEKAAYQVDLKISRSSNWMADIEQSNLSGYEIHMGKSHLEAGSNWLEIVKRSGEITSVPDGAITENGKIWGCYIHGIFNNHGFRHAWLKSLGWQEDSKYTQLTLNEAIDQVADLLEKSIDMARLDQIIGY